MDPRHALELKVPPPVVALVLAAGMWPLAQFTPDLILPSWARWPMCIGLLAAGLACDAQGLLAFRRARTTINPLRPERTRSLVVSGMYRVTRNPMYLGLVCILAAWTVFLESPATLVGPVIFVGYITRFQIVPEERLLLEHFGEQYRAYLQRVPRWL